MGIGRHTVRRGRGGIRFNEALRMLIDWLVTGLIDGTLAAIRDAGVQSVAEVRAFPRRLVRFDERLAQPTLR